MEIISTQVKIDCDILMKLNYEEAAALIDIVGYGYEPFITAFKDKLGKSYIEKHQDGLRSLFEKVWSKLPAQISVVDNAKRELAKLRNANYMPSNSINNNQ